MSAAAETVLLSGELENEYVQALRTALRRARLNRYYADARAVADHLFLMSSEAHQGLYPGLEIGLASGLPSYKEWVRVSSDQQVLCRAGEPLAARAELQRKAQRDPGSIFGKQLLQFDYRTHLAQRQLAAIDALDLKLVRVIPEQDSAEYVVTFDKLETNGALVRSTIELRQTDQRFRKMNLQITGEAVEHTQALRTLIYTLTRVSAEMMFHRLQAEPGVHVYSVTKGAIGPVLYPGVRVPEAFAALAVTSSPVVSFSLDQVHREHQLDHCNDPFLGRAASPQAAELRAQHKYALVQDRKFVAPGSLTSTLQELCGRIGTKNIVYNY